MVHKIETTPLKHILKQIHFKYGITQQEIEEIPSDDSSEARKESKAWFRICWAKHDEAKFENKDARNNLMNIQKKKWLILDLILGTN